MNRHTRCVVLVCVCAYASPSLSLAQQLEPPSTTVRETITSEEIAARREQAENAPDVEDEIRRAIIELYTSAAAHLERAVVAQKLKAGYAANISSIDERLAKTKSQLVKLEDETPSPPEQSTQSYLDQEVLRRQTWLDELRATLSSIEQQITTRPARRREIRSRLAAVQQEIEQLESEIAAGAPTGELPLLTLAKQTNLLALRQQLEVKIPTLRDELALYDGEDVVEFLRFSRELATQQIALAEKSLELVTTATKRVREDTAQETVEKTRNEAATVDPAFHKLADGNNALAEKNRQIAGQVSAAEDNRDKVAKQFDALRRDFDLSNQKVKSVVGLPASLGAVLRKQRSELPNTRELMSEIKQRQQLIDETQLTLFDLDEQRLQLSADREELERAISSVRTITPEAKAVLKSQASDLLTRKQQLLESLLRAEDTYFDVLTDTSIKQQQLVETCHQFATFIDERVLWIRSGPSVFSKAYWQGLRDEKLQIPPLSNIGRLLRDDARQQMLLYVGMALFGLFLLRAGITLKPVLADLGDEARRGSSTRFLPTVRTTLITFVLALPIPLLVGFVAWRLQSGAGNDELLQSLSRGLIAFAAAFLSLELMRQICRTNGLADAHFQWPASAVRLLRSCFTALVILVPLFVLTIEMLSSGQHKHSGSSVVRLVFIACLIIYAVFFVTLFHPGRGVFAEYLNRHHDGWLFRLRFVWYPLTVAIPLGHVVLAAAGYSYTAKHLAARFYITLSLIVASFVVYSLLMRLVLIQRRRLRIAQAKKRQSAALAEQAGVPQSIVAEDVPLADLRDQSDQTRRFLGIVLVGAILLGFWFTWNNVLPALGFLERWPIWTSTQSISESYTDEAGNLKVRPRDVADPITFADLAFAVLIGVVTLVASQNLPGLLEIAVLQQLPIDNSLRYAISTLGKYLIVLVGLFIAFRTVGLRWNQIQWLATALMFGLAFGLQEMFANFVAGVIILFERPIRVGDIVTVDDVTGTVARVRMRATTITNYDRKDYIVPNRDFITGRVLNWTLSDQVNRIVIPVGVAYGSDKQLVRETLRKIAQDHELVVVNPPAQVTFESFGDSSLSFVLRCYISMRDMPYRLDVIDDLHTRIDDAFRAANIEIAFPQRDLHVRSLPVEVSTPGGTPR